MERLKASKTVLIGDKRYTIAVELIIIFTAGIPALRRLASLPYIVILQFLYVLFCTDGSICRMGFLIFTIAVGQS